MSDSPFGGTGHEEYQPSITDIFPSTEYKILQAAEAKEFQAWHKPRKQYVRTAWCREIAEIISEKAKDRKVLRYFGLPGEDFLDLRYFHDELEEDISSLEFLGLDNTRSSNANISAQEVWNLKRVDRTRAVIRQDDLSALSKPKSFALKAMIQAGPFDVINLDLCDSLGRDAPGISASLYNAIAAILGLQQKSSDPWLFLLTTRIIEGAIDPDVLKVLDDLIGSNLDACESFDYQFRSRIVNDFAGTETVKGIDFFNCVACGFAKWFANFSVQLDCEFSIRNALKYSVHKGNAVDMVSLIFRFDPTFPPMNDSAGLAVTVQDTQPECRMVKHIPRVIQEAIDVDELLASDRGEMDRCVQESKRLLVQARYNIEGYDAFANSL